MKSVLEDKVGQIITPSLNAMGYELVRVKFFDQAGNPTLQIMADRHDDLPMTVDDCEKISHTVSAVLDVEDPIDAAYHLEVSSAGIDRPLVREKDFVRYNGYEAKIETILPIDGRRRYRGILKGIENGIITINVDTKDYHVPFDQLGEAKLVLTDALIKEHQEAAKKLGDAKGVQGGEMEIQEQQQD